MIRPPAPRPGHPFLAGVPVLCAHRGGGGIAPENTLEAFREAVEVWSVDMLEMDVRASADGRIVVIHDATVDRTTDGSGRVADLSWAALAELDAAHAFVDPRGRPAYRGRGVRIPLLEEVLAAFPRTRMTVEIKEAAAAEATVELIRRHGAAHRVLVAAQNERSRLDVRGYPGPWGASREQLMAFWLLHATPFSTLYTPGADLFQVPFTWRGRTVVTPRFLAEAHRRNIPVHVWTVNDEALMRRLLALGVDGIQTDRPDVLSRVLSEVADRPAAPGTLGSAHDSGARGGPGTGAAA